MGAGGRPLPSQPSAHRPDWMHLPPPKLRAPQISLCCFNPAPEEQLWVLGTPSAVCPPRSPAPDVVQEGVLGLHGEGQQCHLPGHGAERGTAAAAPPESPPHAPVLTVPEFRYFFFFIFFLGFTTWGADGSCSPQGTPGCRGAPWVGVTPRGAAQGTVAPRGARQGLLHLGCSSGTLGTTAPMGAVWGPWDLGP